ncbi:MAG: hypothetical protein ACQEQO_07540 [Thermodesulfobacteriota bacterium]
MKRLLGFSLILLLVTAVWLPIKPVHAAATELRLTRVHLYFPNNHAEITVKRQHPNLRIFADIKFQGTGLLQGYWEVDGRIIGRVSEHLIPTETPKSLASPKIPELPTTSVGAHRVRFVVTKPKQDIAFPVAVYFVTAETYCKKLAITLHTPPDGADLAAAPVNFTWFHHENMNTYCIEFKKMQKEKPLFSALITTSHYSLGAMVANRIFSEGDEYLWQVTGTDADCKTISRSEVFRFRWAKNE